jgi:hypothetical protein
MINAFTSFFQYINSYNPLSSSQTKTATLDIASISLPSNADSLSFQILNGTNGRFANNQIFWTILAIDPATQRWSYLDNTGQVRPISTAMNDAPGHLTKNGNNYANICFTVDSSAWIPLPKLISGRIFLGCGSPVYIKTYDTGFAGPDVNNPNDPNIDVYFDFIEFTVDDAGYHGNTTRVDGFGFPLQHRLVNQDSSFDRTVGEIASQSRNDLFNAFRNEVPNEFKSLMDIQQPYRILAPVHGPFKDGGQYANYFAPYTTAYTTQEIFLCNGKLAEDPLNGAGANRHVLGQGDGKDVSKYYLDAPANFYAKFWHDHIIDNLAYGFPYDDYNDQAAFLQINNPKALIIRVGW